MPCGSHATYEEVIESAYHTDSCGVGEEMKGLTYTDFTNSENADTNANAQFEWTFEGGLENVVAGISGDITLSFIDFRQEKQGIRMVVDLGERGFVYQAGVLQ